MIKVLITFIKREKFKFLVLFYPSVLSRQMYMVSRLYIDFANSTTKCEHSPLKYLHLHFIPTTQGAWRYMKVPNCSLDYS